MSREVWNDTACRGIPGRDGEASNHFDFPSRIGPSMQPSNSWGFVAAERRTRRKLSANEPERWNFNMESHEMPQEMHHEILALMVQKQCEACSSLGGA